MSSFNVVLQRDQSIQLLSVTISQRGLAQHAFITVLLHHEIAAIVALREDGRDKCSIVESERA